MVFEPRVGGRVYDRGVDGSECRWARVLAYEPPDRFVISWDINTDWELETDLERTSEVEVRFVAEAPERTRVELEHRNLDRHGEGWEERMRDAVGLRRGLAGRPAALRGGDSDVAELARLHASRSMSSSRRMKPGRMRHGEPGGRRAADDRHRHGEDRGPEHARPGAVLEQRDRAAVVLEREVDLADQVVHPRRSLERRDLLGEAQRAGDQPPQGADAVAVRRALAEELRRLNPRKRVYPA